MAELDEKLNALLSDPNSMAHTYFEALAKKYHFSLDTPVKDLPRDVMDVILYGSPEKITIARKKPRPQPSAVRSESP